MKTSMRIKTAAFAVLASLTLAVQTGIVVAAAGAGPQAKPVHQALAVSVSPKKAVTVFESLLKKQDGLPAAIHHLSASLDKCTVNETTVMVLHLENALQANRLKLEDRFAKPSVQASLTKLYKPGDTFTSLANRTTDKKLKSLLLQTALSGYKLETAEGFIFPVINYSIFRQYQPKVTADIQAYIDIMAAESAQAPLKDAAMRIGYQELVNRALAQEQFLAKYPASNRKSQVMALFGSYKRTTFYGANNTPLFLYETSTMAPNAQKGYTLVLESKKNAGSAYLNLLEQFMTLAAKHEYKKTAEVAGFLKKNVPLQ